jgi:endonuclease/exonuclease/phosphatase (EEP) superfamily protein YafD
MDNSKHTKLNYLFVLLVFFHLGSYLGQRLWFFDLISNFRIQILYAFIVFLGFYIYKKNKTFALANLILIVSIILPLMPFYLPKKTKEIVENSLKICSSNLELTNTNIEGLENLISAENPDVLLLMEVTPKWQSLINTEISAKYPYQVWKPQPGYFGIALLSKIPLNHSEIVYSGPSHLPNIIAEISVNDLPITLVGIHPPPPINVAHFKMRNNQYLQINQILQNLNTAIVLMGDFNTTSHSTALKILLQKTRLKDSRIGNGLQPTWSLYSVLPSFFALDHIFVSPDLKVQKRYRGTDISSDHLPILLEVAFH